MALPPGPAWPPAAQAVAWAARPVPLLRACRRRYGDAFTLRFAGVGTYVVLSGPDDIRSVFTAGPEDLRAGEGNALLRGVLGDARVLMLLDGADHLARRRILSRPFHGEHLARWRQTMADVAAREVASWPTGPISLQKPMLDLTMEVILRVVFGFEEGGRLPEIRARIGGLVAAAANPLAMVPWLRRDLGRRSPWARFQARRQAAEATLRAEIAERRRDPRLEERVDVLSALILAGLPVEDLVAELLTLLAAGHETTATSLAWAFERLVRHPAALERLTAEAREGEDDAYASAVVAETLRLRPPLPLLSRKVMRPFEVAGYELPPDVTAGPCPWLVHRRPDLHPDPEAFRPERFLDRPPDPATWLPFGGGPRRCLGASFATLEMTIVLRELLRRVRLAPTREPGELTTRRAIVLAPAGGGRVEVTQASVSS
jgi:cytochrome P450